MEKTERAGQSFKHQLWDLDEECHIEGETEFEAAVAECCDARNRYWHQRVFDSSLRLPGSLLSDDPIDRQLLAADPYTKFHRANEMQNSSSTSVVQTKFCTCGTSVRISTSQISAERKHHCGRYDHGVAQQQFDWKKRVDWTRCRGCSITIENIFLDLHARMPSEVFK